MHEVCGRSGLDGRAQIYKPLALYDDTAHACGALCHQRVNLIAMLLHCFGSLTAQLSPGSVAGQPKPPHRAAVLLGGI